MITLLAGGVGAARLLRGLVRVVPPRDLTVIVNTGDDDEFYGLHVSPDIDTILYTLAGLAPLDRGWGIDGDTFRVLAEMEKIAGRGWFALGDRDLATHIRRTERMKQGATPSEITAELARARGIKSRVLPMTDQSVRTLVATDSGDLAFQDYLVKQRARPSVRAVRYRGIRAAKPAPGVLEAIAKSKRIILAPSNPFVSLGPILAVPGVRAALQKARSRVVAVSPLIGGRAVKGPLASMLRAMGRKADIASIAALLDDVASTLVVSPGDAPRSGVAGDIEIVEHDILLIDPRPAEKLARKLVAPFAAPKPRRAGSGGGATTTSPRSAAATTPAPRSTAATTKKKKARRSA